MRVTAVRNDYGLDPCDCVEIGFHPPEWRRAEWTSGERYMDDLCIANDVEKRKNVSDMWHPRENC